MFILILVFLALPQITIQNYESCIDITHKVDSLENIDTIYPFHDTLDQLRKNQFDYKKTLSIPLLKNDQISTYGVKAFVIEPKNDEQFGYDLVGYLNESRYNSVGLVYSSTCFIYNKDIKVVFLITEHIEPFDIKQINRQNFDNIEYRVADIEAIQKIARIVADLHKTMKNIVVLLPDSFYVKTGDYKIIKYMPLESDNPVNSQLQRFIDVYVDPFILSENYKPAQCSDIYALGMIINSYIYGEPDFSRLEECNGSLIDPVKCMKSRSKIVEERQNMVIATFYDNVNKSVDKEINKEIKSNIDSIIMRIIQPDCGRRPSSMQIAYLLEIQLLKIIADTKNYTQLANKKRLLTYKLNAEYKEQSSKNMSQIIFNDTNKISHPMNQLNNNIPNDASQFTEKYIEIGNVNSLVVDGQTSLSNKNLKLVNVSDHNEEVDVPLIPMKSDVDPTSYGHIGHKMITGNTISGRKPIKRSKVNE